MASSSSLVVGCLAAILLSACTSSSPPTGAEPVPSATESRTTSASGTPTPTPTPTWSEEQAAAVEAVDAYWAAIGRIEVNPAGFSEAEMKAILGKVAGPEVVAANVGSYLGLKERGFRYDGTAVALTTKASEPSTVSYGVEVFVTRCVDQRELRIVDASGVEVSEEELGFRVPDFNLRQYTVVKTKDSDAFIVYGLDPAKGKCGP